MALLLLLGICTANRSDEGVRYEQEDASMFANWYVFFSDGTFQHFYMTDDCQIWYGRGRYSDEGKYRTLYFFEADCTMNDYPRWRIHYETNFQRILEKKKYGFKSPEKNSNTGKPGVKLTKTETTPNNE